MKLEYVDINNIPEKKNRVRYGALSKLIKNFWTAEKPPLKSIIPTYIKQNKDLRLQQV